MSVPTTRPAGRSGPGAEGPRGREVAVRCGLGFLAGVALFVGVWAQFLPLSFYEDFPLGRAWVAVDGPYNEHLVRDVGGLNLALAVGSVAALVAPHRTTVLIAATAWLVYAVPHTVYHVNHLAGLAPVDQVLNVAGLAATVVVPLLLAVLQLRRPAREEDTVPRT